jgi:hypothetical protein
MRASRHSAHTLFGLKHIRVQSSLHEFAVPAIQNCIAFRAAKFTSVLRMPAKTRAIQQPAMQTKKHDSAPAPQNA